MKDVDSRRLRVLLAVARTGGVLAAADELGITASAGSVSHVARLLREIGWGRSDALGILNGS